MVLSVLMRIQWGIGLFCLIFFASFFLIMNVLCEGILPAPAMNPNKGKGEEDGTPFSLRFSTTEVSTKRRQTKEKIGRKTMSTIDGDADSSSITAPSETLPSDYPRVDPPEMDSNGTGGGKVEEEEEEDVKREREISDLEELLSKLNPLADEFVPLSLANGPAGAGFLDSNTATFSPHQQQHYQVGNEGAQNGFGGRRKNNYSQGRRRMTSRTSMAQREERIRRTVYVSDIDLQVTEEQLAALFVNCGQVNDCRICGDPSSVLRFAFVEFNDEESARIALNLAGTVLGFYPVRVLPSKTAIAPVNPTYLPRSEDEREMCTRTIYCTNIDKKITQGDLKLFFENICGEVYRLRLLGDYQHATRIAFVEFVSAESAIKALNCSGVVLGSQPIRVSPSKTPVRPRLPRQPMN